MAEEIKVIITADDSGFSTVHLITYQDQARRSLDDSASGI